LATHPCSRIRRGPPHCCSPSPVPCSAASSDVTERACLATSGGQATLPGGIEAGTVHEPGDQTRSVSSRGAGKARGAPVAWRHARRVRRADRGNGLVARPAPRPDPTRPSRKRAGVAPSCMLVISAKCRVGVWRRYFATEHPIWSCSPWRGSVRRPGSSASGRCGNFPGARLPSRRR